MLGSYGSNIFISKPIVYNKIREGLSRLVPKINFLDGSYLIINSTFNQSAIFLSKSCIINYQSTFN